MNLRVMMLKMRINMIEMQSFHTGFIPKHSISR